MDTDDGAGDRVNKNVAGHCYERVEGGVDWLSCTLKVEDDPTGIIYAKWCHIIAKIGREGHQTKERSLLGYDGITAGNCFCGARADSIYLQLSGAHANDHFAQVDGDGVHYSRIDVQVTIWYKEERNDIAKDINRQLRHLSESGEQRSRLKWYIIEGSDGGDTIYLGAPSSDQRARIYNKSKQSELQAYQRAWRYEVVFRNVLAREWASLTRGKPGGVPDICCATVQGWLRARGVCGILLDDINGIALPKAKHTRSDIEAKLDWLRTQVRPTVAYLTEEGYTATILDVLGLADTA